MTYLLIKIGVNKRLIRIKSILTTLRISYYNGKVGVWLRECIGFESCPIHVINTFYILFDLLYVL